MSYFTNINNPLFTSYDLPFEEKEKLNRFLSVLEESGVGSIINDECKSHIKGGRKGYDPYRLFATVIYAFSKHSGSVRKIEESIKFDLRFLYLMDGNTPTYVTISKFLNNVVVKHSKEIFFSITNTILRKFDICIDDTFLDGTKLEANANKYKFVWKPVSFKTSLFEKIRCLLVRYFEIPESKSSFLSKEVASYLSKLNEIVISKNLDLTKIKCGRGHHLDPLVRDYRNLSDYLFKLLEYEEKEEICGPCRNSYYKTDHDATAMCLKEDYYSGLGSNMHAAYNVQIIVSKGFILDFLISQDRNDFRTFIPCLESFYSSFHFYPKRLCADAGYGSLLNYRFMSQHNIESFVKFSDWALITSGEQPPLYHFVGDDLFCLNNKKAERIDSYQGRHSHSAGSSFYLIHSCRACSFKDYCHKKIKKKDPFRVFEANKELADYKSAAIENLLSSKGIEMRVNRSSQVEGAFGVIKQDMNYDRVRRRGLENVSAEFMLTALGYNIRKLMLLLEGKAKLDYWIAPENLQPEVLPEFNLKKISKKKTKGKNESLRTSYKRKKSR